MKLETQNSYITNPQFTGGVTAVPLEAGPFASASYENPAFGFVAGGLYIGNTGTLVAKTFDGSVLTFVSASGFIPGIFTAVADTTTAGFVLALK
jgi:hypothetical protein